MPYREVLLTAGLFDDTYPSSTRKDKAFTVIKLKRYNAIPNHRVIAITAIADH